MSRRELMKLLGAAAGCVAAEGLLASCSAPASPGVSPTGAASAAPAGSAVASVAPSVIPGSGASPAAERSTAGSWDALLAAGQAEGTLSIAASPDATTRQQLPDAFKAKYGINVDYLEDASAAVSRMQAERAAGQYTVDLVLSGANSAYSTLFPNNWLEPYKADILFPDSADDSKWKAGAPWFRDPSGTEIIQIFSTVSQAITINTQFVSESDVGTADMLLDPRWTGKICAFDPTTNGAGTNTAATFYINKGADFATQLYKGQDIALSHDYTQVAEWVAHGSYPIAIAADLNYLQPYIDAGVTIAQPELPDAPDILGGGFSLLGIIANAPHPNAARVFANWITSQEGMALYARLQVQVPVRNDIDPTWARPSQVPDSSKRYFDAYAYESQALLVQVRDFYTKLLR